MVDACRMHGREDMYRVFVVIQRKLMAWRTWAYMQGMCGVDVSGFG